MALPTNPPSCQPYLPNFLGPQFGEEKEQKSGSARWPSCSLNQHLWSPGAGVRRYGCKAGQGASWLRAQPLGLGKILTLWVPAAMTLGKPISLSEAQIPHLKNANNTLPCVNLKTNTDSGQVFYSCTT